MVVHASCVPSCHDQWRASMEATMKSGERNKPCLSQHAHNESSRDQRSKHECEHDTALIETYQESKHKQVGVQNRPIRHVHQSHHTGTDESRIDEMPIEMSNPRNHWKIACNSNEVHGLGFFAGAALAAPVDSRFTPPGLPS